MLKKSKYFFLWDYVSTVTNQEVYLYHDPVTEGGHTFGGYGICVTGVHQPANSDDTRYDSATTTVEIVHAVQRLTAFLSEDRSVKADTALQLEEHNAVMVMDDIAQ